MNYDRGDPQEEKIYNIRPNTSSRKTVDYPTLRMGTTEVEYIVPTLRKSRQQQPRSRDISTQQTIRMQDKVTEEIPAIYSKQRDVAFTAMFVCAGCLVMCLLLIICMDASAYIQTKFETTIYGEHPVTHLDANFGFLSEDAHRATHIIAQNDDGRIVIVVIPPDPTKTNVVYLPAFVDSSAVIHIEKVQYQQMPALKITVGDSIWYMVEQHQKFVQI